MNKQQVLDSLTESINFVASEILILFLGAIFLGALAFWVFLCFVYSLGIEVLIIGGAVIFYVFSLVSYVLWEKVNFKLKGVGKWEHTTKKNKR